MCEDNPNVVYAYTTQQAIEDGVLFEPYPQRWPSLLITSAVHAICSTQDNRSFDESLVPLLMDCIMKVQSTKKRNWPMVLEHTVVGTSWIMPNDIGGITVMLPSDY